MSVTERPITAGARIAIDRFLDRERIAGEHRPGRTFADPLDPIIGLKADDDAVHVLQCADPQHARMPDRGACDDSLDTGDFHGRDSSGVP